MTYVEELNERINHFNSLFKIKLSVQKYGRWSQKALYVNDKILVKYKTSKECVEVVKVVYYYEIYREVIKNVK